LLDDAIASDAVVQLPLFAVRYTMIYSLPGFASTSSSTDGIILDYEAMSHIWTGRITRWDDPRIAALNPTLAAANRLPSLNITRVVPTTGVREVERRFFGILNYWTLDTAYEFPLTLDEYLVNVAYADNPWVTNQTGILYVGRYVGCHIILLLLICQ
jgi:hypothetical protein